MTKKSLDLKFSKSNLSFHSDIATIKTIIKDFKKSQSGFIAEFTEDDEAEIGRGTSYDVFNEGNKVTIESFKKSLSEKGVVDVNLQNKILCMVLQNRAGLQYPIGNIVNNLFLNNNYKLLMNQDYGLAIEVNSNKKVTLVFNGIWEDYTKNPREPAISVKASVAISSDEVAISNFTITQLSESPVASESYQFLKDNQQNILEKIISHIKQFFGFNDEFKLEENNDENISWSLNKL